MRAIETNLPGILILEPKVFGDDRGFFMETYNTRVFEQLTGCTKPFVQDNHSRSAKGVLRGLHYQIEQAQDKLVRVISGEIFDVAVDIRKQSPNFGQWAGVRLSAANQRQMWVPAGFAHGFLVTSDVAEVIYKVTDYWAPTHERCVRWDDAQINIDWPLTGLPLLSNKDAAGLPLNLAEVFE
jgi:dTDP-4-dehydrorhamnose 3,5-epimerase